MSKILNTSGEFYFAIFGEYSIATYNFSGLKRVMGEIIKARRPEYIAQEIAMKVHYYNIL